MPPAPKSAPPQTLFRFSTRMGTHPSGPALITGTDTTLKSWIEAHPEALGDRVLQRFGKDLPFLFKASGCCARWGTGAWGVG